MNEGVSILQRIRAVRGSLKPSLQRVADFVIASPAYSKSLNVKELSVACEVSEASISRFVRSIGAANYRSFILELADAVSSGPADASEANDAAIYENIGAGDDAAAILSKIVHRHADIVNACSITLDPATLAAAATRIEQSNSLCLFAAGSSILAAESAVVRFSRIGRPAVFHGDYNTQMLAASALPDNALAIAISDSGRTFQTLNCLAAARDSGAVTIALTSFPDAPLTKYADLTILTPSVYEPSGEEPLYENMISKTGQLIAIDVLYSLVAVGDYHKAVARLRRGNSFIQSSRQ